jgi:TRAP-type uncharacterized transport system substrate-binding protein
MSAYDTRANLKKGQSQFGFTPVVQTSTCSAMARASSSSDGSVANIRRIESGASAFGLSQSDVALAAFNGEGPFAAAGPDTELAR